MCEWIGKLFPFMPATLAAPQPLKIKRYASLYFDFITHTGHKRGQLVTPALQKIHQIALMRNYQRTSQDPTDNSTTINRLRSIQGTFGPGSWWIWPAMGKFGAGHLVYNKRSHRREIVTEIPPWIAVVL